MHEKIIYCFFPAQKKWQLYIDHFPHDQVVNETTYHVAYFEKNIWKLYRKKSMSCFISALFVLSLYLHSKNIDF
jgi:hypothetical protein